MNTRGIAENNADLLGLVSPFKFRPLGAIRTVRLLPDPSLAITAFRLVPNYACTLYGCIVDWL